MSWGRRRRRRWGRRRGRRWGRRRGRRWGRRRRRRWGRRRGRRWGRRWGRSRRGRGALAGAGVITSGHMRGLAGAGGLARTSRLARARRLPRARRLGPRAAHVSAGYPPDAAGYQPRAAHVAVPIGTHPASTRTCSLVITPNQTAPHRFAPRRTHRRRPGLPQERRGDNQRRGEHHGAFRRARLAAGGVITSGGAVGRGGGSGHAHTLRVGFGEEAGRCKRQLLRQLLRCPPERHRLRSLCLRLRLRSLRLRSLRLRLRSRMPRIGGGGWRAQSGRRRRACSGALAPAKERLARHRVPREPVAGGEGRGVGDRAPWSAPVGGRSAEAAVGARAVAERQHAPSRERHELRLPRSHRPAAQRPRARPPG